MNVNDIIEKYKHRTLINSKYVFEKKIGSGSFGSVFRGKNIISEDKVAIKFEATTVEFPTLLWESKILNHLSGIPGVVKLRYFGTEANKNIIVMDLYSHTLCEEVERLKNAKKALLEESSKESENDSPKNDSPKRETNTSSDKVEFIRGEYEEKEENHNHDHNHHHDHDNADNIKNNEETDHHHIETNDQSISQYTKEITEYLISMLQIINRVHDAGVVHRDIKPENFMFSIETKKDGDVEKKLNIIDFGLSRFYMKGDKHVTNTYNKTIVGTLRYISKNVHNGEVYSRRDDIISIMYVVIYLLKGKLNWSGIVAKNGDKRTKEELVYDKKIKTTSHELCAGLPHLYQKLIDYAYKLEFEEKPDYLYMIRQCKNFLKMIH
jgi:serine/threonine protein kinase